MRRFESLVVLGAFMGSAALAHHSASVYDMTGALVTIEGTLTKVDWANPHIYLTVETAGPNGQRVLQQVEAVSISLAQATGLTREVLTLGSPVVINAYPNRRGNGTVLGMDITTSDGNQYPLRGGRSSRPPIARQDKFGRPLASPPRIYPRRLWIRIARIPIPTSQTLRRSGCRLQTPRVSTRPRHPVLDDRGRQLAVGGHQGVCAHSVLQAGETSLSLQDLVVLMQLVGEEHDARNRSDLGYRSDGATEIDLLHSCSRRWLTTGDGRDYLRQVVSCTPHSSIRGTWP
jgi:uncharacterized protein DUF6152